MRFIYTSFFIITAPLLLRAQELNSLKLMESFSSPEEFVISKPELQKDLIVMDSEWIKILNYNQTITKKQLSRKLLPPNLNSFHFSISRKNFVAFEEMEVATDYLYFYSFEGILLNKQKINVYPDVKFSKNGEFVVVFNNFGAEFFIFRKDGSLFLSGNYMNLIGDRTKVLYSMILSNTGDQLLINAGEDAYLINTKNKLKIFEAKVGRVLDGAFNKDVLSLEVIAAGPNKVDLLVLSRVNGSQIDSIKDVLQIDFGTSNIVVAHADKINLYEYK